MIKENELKELLESLIYHAFYHSPDVRKMYQDKLNKVFEEKDG